MSQAAHAILREASTGQWLRFSAPREIVETRATNEVAACLDHLAARVESEGLHAIGFLAYEAAPAFDRALTVRPAGRGPLVWFGLFPPPEVVAAPRRTAAAPHDWQPSIDRAHYEAAVAEIRRLIAAGETYQVNYTFRLRAAVMQGPWELFASLVEAQRPDYAAFIETAQFAVASASPELFFDLHGDVIRTQPMKGTTRRGLWPADDAEQARRLAASVKNRAENAMIVDMMRNDLGKIARVGSITVRDLFHVARYPTLWQMTSRIDGRTDASVAKILAALFPCASITGAPKARTMHIIARLETEPRGVYTGSIGWIAPGRRAQFNVAIRTVYVDKTAKEAEYGVGGGVVWDSTPGDEYEECLLKARIVTATRPEFSLLESLRWTPAEGLFLLEEHMGRMRDSAAYFDFDFPEDALRRRLHEGVAALPPLAHKVRLLLDRTGAIQCAAAPLKAKEFHDPVRLALAPRAVASTDPFLYHKTTQRTVYDLAIAGAEAADDVLLYNERGEITETCRGNIALRLDGRYLTPPRNSGLLAGTYRGVLLAQGRIRERRLPLALLAEAEEIAFINSVRGWRRAVLVQ